MTNIFDCDAAVVVAVDADDAEARSLATQTVKWWLLPAVMMLAALWLPLRMPPWRLSLSR